MQNSSSMLVCSDESDSVGCGIECLPHLDEDDWVTPSSPLRFSFFSFSLSSFVPLWRPLAFPALLWLRSCDRPPRSTHPVNFPDRVGDQQRRRIATTPVAPLATAARSGSVRLRLVHNADRASRPDRVKTQPGRFPARGRSGPGRTPERGTQAHSADRPRVEQSLAEPAGPAARTVEVPANPLELASPFRTHWSPP